MMEPDVRIQTNREGFCRLHYDMMFVRKNRLGMALTLESHLKELKDEIRDGGLGAPGARPVKRIAAMEESCYVCRRIAFNFEHMAETVVYLWDTDEKFPAKLEAQPYFCLPIIANCWSTGKTAGAEEADGVRIGSRQSSQRLHGQRPRMCHGSARNSTIATMRNRGIIPRMRWSALSAFCVRTYVRDAGKPGGKA